MNTLVDAQLGWSLGAFALLLAHAMLTHGAWFTATWLGLTTATGLVLFSADSAVFCGVVVYLAGLLAKGFAERTRWRGAIPPFVLLHGLFAAWITLPWILVVHRALEPSALARDPANLAVTAAAFGLAYRLVSRRTEEDRRKFLVLAAGLAVVAGAAWVAG